MLRGHISKILQCKPQTDVQCVSIGFKRVFIS